MDATPLRAADVAAEFLRLANEARRNVRPFEVTALTVIANGWNLANKGAPLIAEPVTMGEYAPEIAAVGRAITQRSGYVRSIETTRAVPGAEANLIAGVYGIYGRMGEDGLRRALTRPDSPWSLMRPQTRRNDPIPDEVTAAHYAILRRERDARLGVA